MNHLGPICSQSLSADDTRVIEVISKAYIKYLPAVFLSSAEFFLNHFLGLFFHEYHQRFKKKVWVRFRLNVLSGAKPFANVLPNDSIRL